MISHFTHSLPASLHALTNAWLLVCSPLRWLCPHALITASGKSWLPLNRHLKWLTAVLLLTFTSCWGRCPVTHTDPFAVWFKKGIGNPVQRHPLVPVYLELCLICSDSTDLCLVACCVPMQKLSGTSFSLLQLLLLSSEVFWNSLYVVLTHSISEWWLNYRPSEE